MKTNKLKLYTLSAVAASFGLSTVNAAIIIHGSTTAYQESNGDWLTAGTNDIDSSGGLGTDGYLFFGDGSANTTQNTGQVFTVNTTVSPTYVAGFAAGSNFASIADDVNGYGSYDDFIALDGSDTLGGIAVAVGGAAGTNLEVMTFTLSGLAANTTVRVGVLSNVDNNTNGRWDPTSIYLGDGVTTATVGSHTGTQLSNTSGATDWVFFDIDADGTYALGGTKRLATQGVSIAGITFDSVTVPEPSSTALIGLGLLGFIARRQR